MSESLKIVDKEIDGIKCAIRELDNGHCYDNVVHTILTKGNLEKELEKFKKIKADLKRVSALEELNKMLFKKMEDEKRLLLKYEKVLDIFYKYISLDEEVVITKNGIKEIEEFIYTYFSDRNNEEHEIIKEFLRNYK